VQTWALNGEYLKPEIPLVARPGENLSERSVGRFFMTGQSNPDASL